MKKTLLIILSVLAVLLIAVSCAGEEMVTITYTDVGSQSDSLIEIPKNAVASILTELKPADFDINGEYIMLKNGLNPKYAFFKSTLDGEKLKTDYVFDKDTTIYYTTQPD